MFAVPGPDFPCVIEPLGPGDVDEATRCYTGIFLEHEPLTATYRVSWSRFYPPARVYVALCAKDSLSFIARDKESGRIAGFIFCSDMSTDWASRDPGMEKLYSLFPEISRVLGSLEHNYKEHYPSGKGEALHVFQAGCLQRLQGRGIAKALVSTAMENALNSGFLYAVAECTSPVSRGLFSSCGFLPVYEADPRDLPGDTLNTTVELPCRVTLMVRKL